MRGDMVRIASQCATQFLLRFRKPSFMAEDLACTEERRNRSRRSIVGNLEVVIQTRVEFVLFDGRLGSDQQRLRVARVTAENAIGKQGRPRIPAPLELLPRFKQQFIWRRRKA